MDDDGRLLRRFAEDGSEEAFALLTKRHLGLVYAVCRRELDSNEAAEDAAQAVFLLLAQKAKTLRAGPSLAGWLFQTAHLVARNARTQAARRAHYEGKAAAIQTPPDDHAVWSDIEPLLNSSLAALPARDREGVLLRFFQGLTFAEMGVVLGLSEEAARKRVGRALEKLRRFFEREGVTLPSTVLPTLLSAHALHPVPDHLAGATAATLAGAAPAKVALITQRITHSMKLLKLKLAAGAAALFIAGTATYVLAQNEPAKPPAEARISLESPINAGHPTIFTDPGPKDAVRNVTLSGKVRYGDGRPAGGFTVYAKIQNKDVVKKVDASLRLQRQSVPPAGLGNEASASPFVPAKKQQVEEESNHATSRPDGTYVLPVGAALTYNVMILDSTGRWVAAAIEGASGAKTSTVPLPDLVLTPGAIITGTVTDAEGVHLSGIYVESYGPQTPETSAINSAAKTDNRGNYRLRVAPGVSRIRIAVGSSLFENGTKSVTVVAGEIKTVDLTQ